LLSKVSKNSHNSSKPPSSDSFTRHTKSLRKPSDKKAGGQPGHEGTTLKMVLVADEVVVHRVKACGGCGKDISCIGTQISEHLTSVFSKKTKKTLHFFTINSFRIIMFGYKNLHYGF